MALLIKQQPLYNTLPIGQQIIFAVSDPTIVANKYKVKFVAQVHISNFPINLSNNNALIGTFKTTPNDAGVGIFDFRPVIETFVKPDHEPQTTIVSNSDSEYKGTTAQSKMFPIHIVDKFAISKNSIKRFGINFFIEYSDSATGAVIDFETLAPTPSESYKMFNGVVQYDDVLDVFQNDYGFNINKYYLDGSSRNLLTTAPTTQYARLEDYGTLSFLHIASQQDYPLYGFNINYRDSAGGSLGGEVVQWNGGNGGATSLGPLSNTRLNYFGAFPANLKNWSATFATAVTNGLSYYEITAIGSGVGEIWSKTYTINVLCPNLKGYEAIRLTWLNKWGTWDYYTLLLKLTEYGLSN